MANIRIPAVVSQAQQSTVIFLHGFGQNNELWRQTVRDLASRLPSINWILPQASTRSMTGLPGTYSSWFNTTSMSSHHNDWDEAGMSRSVNTVEHLILSEVHAGIDPRKIVLVGFGQGATLALVVALTTLHDLGGVASLSGSLPPGPQAREQLIHAYPTLPIFYAYGRLDTVLPPALHEETMCFIRDVLRLPSDRLTFKRYCSFGHSVSEAEISDFSDWLSNILHL